MTSEGQSAVSTFASEVHM